MVDSPSPKSKLRVINVMAASLDGRIAMSHDQRDEDRAASGFVPPEDREHLLKILASADAVIVGSSSLKASGGALEAPKKDGSMPIWMVLTNHGLPDGSLFFSQTHIPRWLVSKAPLQSVPHDISTMIYGEASPAPLILETLERLGAQRVLLFGGSFVNKIFYEAQLVDELILTICPVIIAHHGAVPLVAHDLPREVPLTLKTSQTQGNLVFLHYHVQKS